MAGCNRNRKKPAGRPKSTTTEVLDIANIHQDWDGCAELRERVLNEGDLLVEPHEDNIPSSVANFLALQPFITRMSLSSTRPLPAIETLREEVERFYLKCKRGGTPQDSPDVVAISWKLRKMLGFIKMKVRRREVSSAPLLNFILMTNHVRKEKHGMMSPKKRLSHNFLYLNVANPRCLPSNKCVWSWTLGFRCGVNNIPWLIYQNRFWV